MVLLLTVLSGLAGALLLVVLAVGLFRILRVLTSIRESLSKIAMGVRAIDSETAPLSKHLGRLNDTLTTLGGGLGSVNSHLKAAGDKLERVGGVLRK
jgi:hypothetical protein